MQGFVSEIDHYESKRLYKNCASSSAIQRSVKRKLSKVLPLE